MIFFINLNVVKLFRSVRVVRVVRSRLVSRGFRRFVKRLRWLEGFGYIS
jgi:hypothetical protein